MDFPFLTTDIFFLRWLTAYGGILEKITRSVLMGIQVENRVKLYVYRILRKEVLHPSPVSRLEDTPWGPETLNLKYRMYFRRQTNP